ncbi:hypothetical protein [Dyadobacter sp. CY343]|uniref:glycosyl-4,4'-diaponeurosporenoate acyltransferase CrtO family protein n=1 Tax=Dyadobacter sp. CY343 TaxID=2907299 RepID=UPI001F40072F|nr:hypothetical protein [Dyadobacter sp. CY343]MCE7059770.1 hypothetical protein [Dyadobacter sp. CY343]
MLNQLINVFWTIASFAAVGYYWGLYFAERKSPYILIVFVALSILGSMLPRKWLSALTLSNDRRTYERLGVTFILRFVQNGTFVKRIEAKFGRKVSIVNNQKKALAYLGTINVQERYHYCCLVFFILSSISALFTGKIALALLITLSNIIYNIYPILLQQYNRLRIHSMLSRQRMPATY